MTKFKNMTDKIKKNNDPKPPAMVLVHDVNEPLNSEMTQPELPLKAENESSSDKQRDGQFLDVIKSSEYPRAQRNNSNPKTERISLLVTPQIKVWIIQKATEQGISKNDFVNQALEKLMSQE
jgi:predicted DNA binding CopG/RHH family protein